MRRNATGRPSNITKSEAARFNRDLEALIRRAQDGNDMGWVPVCLWLLEARKALVPMMKPEDVKELA